MTRPYHQVADPDTWQIRVLRERCSSCIFRAGNPMHLEPGRVRDMVDEAIACEGHIVCHQTLDYGQYPDAPAAICRGFADAYGRNSLALRIGHALGTLTEVDPPGEGTE